MSEARTLIERITEFRRRLERMPALSEPPKAAEATPEDLSARVDVAARQQEIIENALRRLSDPKPRTDTALPVHLTARAKRLLAEGKALVGTLRAFAVEPTFAKADESDPLAHSYRESVAMTEACLRLAMTFPDSPSEQMRLCDGLTAMFDAVRGRAALIRQTLDSRAIEIRRVERVAELLRELDAGGTAESSRLDAIIEDVLSDVDAPLRFAHGSVAAHSLTVARVIARLTVRRGDVDFTPTDAVRAALLHDVGMLRVPAELLGERGRLSDPQRRTVEAHVRVSTDTVMERVPNPLPIIDAVAQHHERLDGSGYPGKLKADRITPLARLLAAADVYAALATARPHRPAFDPRTALTDTLLLAERGELDRHAAERLLRLSFYPVGTVVEMADGSLGVVTANPFGRPDLLGPARPVVDLLTDPDGNALPSPRPLDLSQTEAGGIVRGVPAARRREVLGARFPQYS